MEFPVNRDYFNTGAVRPTPIYSPPPRPAHRSFTLYHGLYLSLVVLFLAVSYSHFLSTPTPTVTYCNTGTEYESCTSCPEYGKCFNGRWTGCSLGYVIFKNKCVLNRDALVTSILNCLESHERAKSCAYSTTSEPYTLTELIEKTPVPFLAERLSRGDTNYLKSKVINDGRVAFLPRTGKFVYSAAPSLYCRLVNINPNVVLGVLVAFIMFIGIIWQCRKACRMSTEIRQMVKECLYILETRRQQGSGPILISRLAEMAYSSVAVSTTPSMERLWSKALPILLTHRGVDIVLENDGDHDILSVELSPLTD